MLDLYLLIDIAAIVALCMLGVVVLIKDRHSRLNRIFVGFVLSVSVWIIANYISNDTNNSGSVAVKADYLVFSFSYFAIIFLLWFTLEIVQLKKVNVLFARAHYLLWPIGVAFGTPLLVRGVHLQEKVYAVQFGPLLPLYAIMLIGSMILTVLILRSAIKTTDGNLRARLRSLYISLILSLPILLLAQFIIPAVTGWFGLTNIGVLSTLGVVYGLYYGVAKHRLFGLHPTIVRSIAYVVTIGVLVLTYSIISYYFSHVYLGEHNAILHTAASTLLILIVITAYQPLRAFFRKLTYKFFYQDIYNPQQLYTDLNTVLISSININTLLEKVSELLGHTLNIRHCSIIVESGGNHYMSHSSLHDFPVELVEYIPWGQGIIMINDAMGVEHRALREKCEELDVACIAPLSLKTQKQSRTLGYIIFGEKNNGYSFNEEDVHIIGIITDELTIAFQNALQYEEIQQFNKTLQLKVEEATRKLRNSNERLKKLDETKDDFISMASHQLRTPLTSVKGYVSMVLDGDAGTVNDGQRKMLNQAFVSAQRMVFLISDLLNLSRLNTGRFVIEAKPIDLRVVISEELKQLEETAAARGIKLVYKRPETFPTLMFDDMKIRQVVMNFVDNAIYYTPANGTVTIELHEDDKYVEFRVKDTGIGVPRHEQPHLFTKFYRAQNARQARPDGTGLGLFMAKKVIIAQGGVVIFESREGKGSIFGFHFSKEKLAVFGAGSPGPTGVEASAAGS